ncbi:MAG TPA: CBS domain-containing protein [Bdellovibrionales bacterium]|nr:CBS domain-containing protein [Bdellovibrionales bacterium]
MPLNSKSLSPPTLLVSEIMTAGVHSIRPEMKIYEVIELLIRHHISGAPVVDHLDQVLSVVSEGDVLRLAALEGLEATVAHCLPQLPRPKNLITVQRTQSFADAYRLFIKHSLHRIIVVDSNGRLHGVVTRADILRIFVEAKHGKKIKRGA